eukprot:GCRY01000833.1.p1 GENE.GCRY01000833.1~~GCRY01000833.1.p1  ORF type:complete len:241 (+),score=30.02 GCRY01000833.1:150-872(+)
MNFFVRFFQMVLCCSVIYRAAGFVQSPTEIATNMKLKAFSLEVESDVIVAGNSFVDLQNQHEELREQYFAFLNSFSAAICHSFFLKNEDSFLTTGSFNHTCYAILKAQKTGLEGAAKCQSLGMIPAEIRTQEQNEYLAMLGGLTGDAVLAVFIGGRQKEEVETYYWLSDPSTVLFQGNFADPHNPNGLYVHWASAEPNNVSENCIELYTDTHPVASVRGYWNDRPCSTVSHTVCQLSVTG